MFKRCLLMGLALILLVGVGGVTGCGGGGSSPSAVVKAFYSAINAGDFDKADEYLAPGDSVKGLDLCQFAGKIERIEILYEDIGEMFGEKVASVKVNVTLTPAGESHPFAVMQKGTKTFLLERYKTGWKIVYWY